jgi:hypothetical protein
VTLAVIRYAKVHGTQHRHRDGWPPGLLRPPPVEPPAASAVVQSIMSAKRRRTPTARGPNLINWPFFKASRFNVSGWTERSVAASCNRTMPFNHRWYSGSAGGELIGRVFMARVSAHQVHNAKCFFVHRLCTHNSATKHGCAQTATRGRAPDFGYGQTWRGPSSSS